MGNIGRGVWDQAELEVRCALERDPGYAQAQEVEDQLRLRRSGVLPDMSGFVSYRIRAGDQLGDIAKLCLNQANRFVELAVLNGIENPSRLRPGQLLRIPTTKPCVNCADLRRAALAEEQSTGVERAYALIAAARRSCPNDSDITQDTDRLKSALVTDLHGRAEALLSEGDSGGAAELWQRVIKLDPGNAEAMYFLRSLQN
ncbi:MAG: LysM domain-containing protein [Pseudomonadota bacterium]